ncbi:MAG TPA: amino acid ABC transporter permease [Candidatus Dormibacteraeota bacterium]|nr:amino acid ABC transporter permease [Candidatus Dormibacteraeota bacterium]
MSWNPTGYEFAWDVVSQYRVWLWEGTLLSLKLAAVSMAFAMALALVLALLRMSPFWPIKAAAMVYIAVLRAIPLLVFILWTYYGVALVIGLNVDPFTAGVICLALQYSAWLAEIYRAGLQAIDKGQREAALSTGLSQSRTFMKVVWPQAWRIIIPPLASNFIGIIKDSSLVGIIGLNELMRQSQIAVSLSFRPFELYTAAMIIYIALALIITPLSSLVERRATRSLRLHSPRQWGFRFVQRAA